ncbi:MAG: hypothetical protein QME79_07815 [Bacillota bacterium]|nr:hypothetical protein [Bacillota bacterium]
MTKATRDDREELERLLEGKVVAAADLRKGTVRLTFTDGTRFERAKTFEGEIVATLFAADGGTIATARIWP